jgi:hypothetical protein
MEPGEGVVVFGAHDGKLPKAVVLRASVNGENLDVRAKRGSKEFAKAMRAVVLSQVQLDPDVGAKERRAVLRLIEQSPVVGRHSSLIALDDRDAFARERLARIKKWGSGQFRRVVSQEEDLVTEEPLGLATMAEPAGKGSAHIASYRSTGELDQKIIKRLITAHVLPQARACYEKEIRRDRSLRGDMTLEVEMARGEVQFAKVGSSTLASGNIERCVIDAAYSIPVPAVAQGDALEVTYLARYPLRFRIKDQKGRVGLADSPTPPERIDPSGSTDPLDGLPTD